MADLILAGEEVKRVSGGYSQPAKQLAELHRQGFWRARRSKITGEVILERAHYDAVCSGREHASVVDTVSPTPRLRPA